MPAKTRVKARSALHLIGGERVKIPESILDAVAKYARMTNAKPGSAFRWDKVTDHGTLKVIFIPVGLITCVEEL